MSYAKTEALLRRGGIVILDGGTGTELERRGVPMDPKAWCGPAALENSLVLEGIHRDYIAAGADIVTANTFASSRLMLQPAGFADRFEEINRAAIGAALRARAASGRDDVLVAGSLSHMHPFIGDPPQVDPSQVLSEAEMADAFGELAMLLCDEGCDLIILEMMCVPERMGPAFTAAAATGLPVWAGFSARRGEDGQVLSFATGRDIPFAELLQVLKRLDVSAAGIMHTPANVIGDALEILRGVFSGPFLAYPNSGYFKMPQWQFKNVIPPDELLEFATDWVEKGVQIVGGCCGLSPEHIAALGPLKHRNLP
ncbi:MAG: homocysteine S-methyltransferase family protein [Proteobacteria bacterium]|nr:homocysteine S-methyltransferase family protein [Pseudomonadota bacterium]